MRIDNFLKNLTIEELLEVRSKSSGIIRDFKDGYFYICEVRSYGRNWKEWDIYNTHTLQELCYLYGGDDGIVDVYSNNPNLSSLYNYGEVMFIPTKEDLANWKDYTYLANRIPRVEEELDKWDKRDDVPFKYRPMFAPTHSREDLEHLKKRLEDFDMSFVAPVRVVRVYDDEE
jgi:hypothetical protein